MKQVIEKRAIGRARARRTRSTPLVAFTALILAGSLLAQPQRVEAQGATSLETVVRSDTDTIAVQLDASGNPAILFDGMKASCADPDCSFPAIDSFFEDFPGKQFATRNVGFDAQGYPYLQYYGSRFDSDLFPDILVRCLDLDCDSLTTHEIPDLPSGHLVALRNDRLAMFLYQNEGTDKLKLAHCVDLACTSLNMVRTIAANGRPAAIDVDNDGNPIIVFSLDAQVGWSIARCNDLACSAPVVTALDLTGQANGFSIAVGDSDEPVLSFANKLGYFDDADLKLLQCDDPDCRTSSTRVIDSGRRLERGRGAAGRVTAAIELDDNGFPVLAFRKSGTIRLARCHDDACTILSVETVDKGTGRAPALALDELDHPVLAYRDSRLGSLKLARCGNPSCLEFVGETPDPGSYNLRSVATGRYLDANRNGFVGTSRVSKLDDVWNLDLVIAGSSLPFTLANGEYKTSIGRRNWVPEGAGDGTFYLRRLDAVSRNYLSTSGRNVLFATRDRSDRWEFIPAGEGTP